MANEDHQIKVEVVVTFVPERSSISESIFHFSYVITISNMGTLATKLLGRHWFITDGFAHVSEVQGLGVVGEQPYLEPGDFFEYTSYAMLPTPVGSMHGSYEMIDEKGNLFFAEIKPFSLAMPRVLH
jgi:ApaG protein